MEASIANPTLKMAVVSHIDEKSKIITSNTFILATRV